MLTDNDGQDAVKIYARFYVGGVIAQIVQDEYLGFIVESARVSAELVVRLIERRRRGTIRISVGVAGSRHTVECSRKESSSMACLARAENGWEM